MSASLDRAMMRAALRAAKRGRPSPNPHVGAVIAHGEEIVGIGHHARAGLAHAEVAAIRAAGSLTKGATLYVTLEPCNHFGRTPPCTDAILEAGIRRVVIGCADPKPHVPGATQKLRDAGIEVELGVCERDAKILVQDFVKHIRTGLPYVRIKAAVTLDGNLAAPGGDSKWITGPRARRHAHRLRDRSDAVLVGIGTVLRDDPSLTVRDVRGVTPLRVIVDAQARTPPTARVLEGGRAIVFHASDASRPRVEALVARGAETVSVARARSGGGLDLREVLAELGKRHVVRLLVEGGGALIGSFLRERLADAASVFVAPRILGGRGVALSEGVSPTEIASAIKLAHIRRRRFGDDTLIEGEIVFPET